MGGGEAVALSLTDRQRHYLRRALADCKAGREDDLLTHPDHPNADRWRADADAYRRLIAGVDAREGLHRDWNTAIYNFGRHEVRGFLIAGQSATADQLA